LGNTLEKFLLSFQSLIALMLPKLFKAVPYYNFVEALQLSL
jgi:hypothetical protein